MYEVGEVREFATGMMICVASDGVTPGSFAAKMQIVQKIWTGEAWLEAKDPAAGAALRKMSDARR